MLRRFSVLLLAVTCGSAVFAQTQIRVDVTAVGPVGLAPAFAAFHDGSYDIFDVGGTASAGLELSAEVGDNSILMSTLPAGVTGQSIAAGGPFAPNGGTASQTFTVTNAQASFNIVAMILPSNDWFIGNSNALDVSSLLNGAPGTALLLNLVRGYDAGTESEDFAFSPGNGLVGITTPADPAGGASTNTPISVINGPNPFAGFANIQPANFNTSSIDFTNGIIASVTLTVVPEPSMMVLAATALVGLLGVARRRKG